MPTPALALAVAVHLLAAAAPPKSSPWAMERLDLDVTVDPTARALRVRGKMRVRAEAPRLSALTLALNTRKRAMEFERVRAGDADAALSFASPKSPTQLARVRLGRAVERGDSIEVEFEARSVGTSSQLALGGDAFFVSWVEGWYPLPASDDGRLIAPPEAPGTTRIRSPRGWRTVSNGTRATAAEGDVVVETWTAEAPVARSFVAAPFLPERLVERNGRTVGFHLLRARDTANSQADVLSKAIAAMEQRFGAFPFAAYHVVEVPEAASFAAASEQGFIMVRASVLDDARGTVPLFAHEAAHAWWGNRVRAEGPGSKLLDEALAQLGAAISIEALEGRPAMVEFLRFSRPGYNPLQCAFGYFYIWRKGGDVALARLADREWDHNLADSKGLWFWHMLRERMGDDPFFSELRGILRDSSGRPLRLGEIRRRFEARDASLGAFFAQWLDRAGAPVLRVDWSSDNPGKAALVTVEQLQPGAPFEVSLEVEVQTASGLVRKTLPLRARRGEFRIDVPSRPLGFAIDPEHHLLTWRPEYGPRP